jgi:hypothetical protein
VTKEDASAERAKLIDIEGSALAFRKAVVLARAELPEEFRGFPAGCCGDASELLAAHLTELGHGPFTYVFGLRGEVASGTHTSHAWLTLGELVVDITADQFPEVANPVIVTTDSAWHRTFRIDQTRVADFRQWDEATVARLSHVFATIRRQVAAGRSL